MSESDQTRQNTTFPSGGATAHGYLAVPDFPRVYRRRNGEAALDNLCGLWNVGASTVYRSLKLFVDCGLAWEHRFLSGKTCFEKLGLEVHGKFLAWVDWFCRLRE